MFSVALPAGAVSVVVLDEADKMLSMGFEPQLTRLRRMLCPPKADAATGASAVEGEAPARQRPQVITPLSWCDLAGTQDICTHHRPVL